MATHLAAPHTATNPTGTQCKTFNDGDRSTMNRQNCTCSLCQMHEREFEAYYKSLSETARKAEVK